PSWLMSRLSIATSPAVAFRLGPVHFVGTPFRKFQRTFSRPDSSHTLIEPFLCWICPSMVLLRHCHNPASPVMPRLRDMVPDLANPGSLRTVRASDPSRYSTGPALASNP